MLVTVLLLFYGVFLYLRIVGRNDAGVTTYASTRVVFISHAAAVVIHEKNCTLDFPEVLSLLGADGPTEIRVFSCPEERGP